MYRLTGRLTDAEVEAIKKKSRSGYSFNDIAEIHEIPPKAVRFILKRKTK